MFRTVVVGVDGREGGRDALRLAGRLIDSEGDLVALRVVPWRHRPAPTRRLETERGAVKAALDRDLAEARITARSVAVGDTSRARALHGVAEREHADLIVVGSTHRGRIGRVLVGNVALGTLHGSPCPVAVAPRGISAGRGMPQRIGVGFDGGDESRRALRVAVELAQSCGARLELLAVIADQPLLAVEAVDSRQWVIDWRDEQELLIQRTIDELPVEADGEAIIGDPVEKLVALSQRVDLLVVGSRGWGPVDRILLGSTAARLVHHAACPALLVPRGNATGQPGEQLPGRAGSRRLVA
jgi:nucleotide-binding universal stress UspA family protein